jgi:electron-transferring-flavoprotein dehydrogenase
MTSKLFNKTEVIHCLGMLAAESAYRALSQETIAEPVLLDDYENNLKDSWVWKELWAVRNVRPSFHNPLGLYGGLLWSGLDLLFFRGKLPLTLSHGAPDYSRLKPAKECTPIDYPKPDGVISFDLLTNLARSGTNHADDQPIHLTLKDKSVPVERNLAIFDGPENRFCPGLCGPARCKYVKYICISI